MSHIRFAILFSLTFVFSIFSHSHEGHSRSCQSVIVQDRASIIGSGRDQDVLPTITDYANRVFGKGGVLEKLGLGNISPQILHFVPGHKVGMLAANNRLPHPHWIDGVKVARAMNSVSGVYELVFPGGAPHHAIYRDDMPVARQIGIINHVIGHVLFAMYHPYPATNTAHGVNDAMSTYRFMEQLYLDHDPEEVSRWYTYLNSLEWLQDIVVGLDETPDFFRRKVERARILAKAKDSRTQFIPQTRNLYSFIVANLPIETPDWARELAERMYSANRYVPGAIRTKVANEGLATLMMTVLAENSGLPDDFVDRMELCCLLAKVVVPALDNPYFMGLEAWKNHRKKFHSRPEIRNLPLIEKDRLFLEWALPKVVGEWGDYRELLRNSFDQDWFDKHNLVIMEPTLRRGQPAHKPPPNLKAPEVQVVKSRKAQDVIDALITRGDSQVYQNPTPSTIPSDAAINPVLELENVAGIGKFQPLHSRSLVATLWVMTQLLSKPVALESTFIESPRTEQIVDWRKRTVEEVWPKEAISVRRIRTLVHPDGRVEVQTVYRDNKTGPDSIPIRDPLNPSPDVPRDLRPDPKLTAQFQMFLGEHIEELFLNAAEVPSHIDLSGRSMTTQATEVDIMGIVHNSVDNIFPFSMFEHAPTVPKALSEYAKMLQLRLARMLKRALTGQSPTRIRGGHLQVRVLPEIPRLRYNRTIDGQSLIENQGLADAAAAAADPTIAMKIGDGSPLQMASGPRIGHSSRGTGEIDWGEGEQRRRPRPDVHGEETSDDGEEEGEADEPGDTPSSGHNDPSFVDVPDELWGEVMGEEIQLPNPRPLREESDRRRRVPGRSARKKAGIPRFDLMAKQAIKLGISSMVAEADGNTDQVLLDLNMDPTEVMRRGLQSFGDSDWFVRGKRLEIKPDINAVVTVICDFSGSMESWIRTVRRIAFDLRALLLNSYSEVKIRIVVFDGEAVVLDSIESLKTIKLSGGTSYHKAIKKAHEDFEENFPAASYDRYPVLVGDLVDNMSDAAKEAFMRLHEDAQFTSVLQTVYAGMEEGDWADLFSNMKANDPHFGFERIDRPEDYTPLIFKRVFKNEPK